MGQGEPARAGEEPDEVTGVSIVEAQEALTASVIDLPGVTGTAVGLCADEPCIKVYIAAPSDELFERIPDTFRGFLVDVEVTGELRARGDTAG